MMKTKNYYVLSKSKTIHIKLEKKKKPQIWTLKQSYSNQAKAEMIKHTLLLCDSHTHTFLKRARRGVPQWHRSWRAVRWGSRWAAGTFHWSTAGRTTTRHTVLQTSPESKQNWTRTEQLRTSFLLYWESLFILFILLLEILRRKQRTETGQSWGHKYK